MRLNQCSAVIPSPGPACLRHRPLRRPGCTDRHRTTALAAQTRRIGRASQDLVERQDPRPPPSSEPGFEDRRRPGPSPAADRVRRALARPRPWRSARRARHAGRRRSGDRPWRSRQVHGSSERPGSARQADASRAAAVTLTAGLAERRRFQVAVLEGQHPVHVAGQLHVVGGDQGGDALVAGQVVEALRTPRWRCRGRGCRWARRPGAAAASWPGRGRWPRAAARRRTAGPAGARRVRPGRARPAGSSPARARASSALAGDQQRQGHVVQRAELGQQVVELVDEADRGQPHPGARPRRAARSSPRPRSRPRPPSGRSSRPAACSRRRLARARRPDQADDLAGMDVEVDALAAPCRLRPPPVS